MGWLRRVRSPRGARDGVRARPCWPPVPARVGEGRRNTEAENVARDGENGERPGGWNGRRAIASGWVSQPVTRELTRPRNTQPDRPVGGPVRAPGEARARPSHIFLPLFVFFTLRWESETHRARAGWVEGRGTHTDRRVGPATTLPPSSPDMSHLIPIGQLLLSPASRSLLRSSLQPLLRRTRTPLAALLPRLTAGLIK